MKPWFIATEKFGPESGEAWTKYIKWSGLIQLEELVSLDYSLCPTVLPTIKDEYWPHIVNADFMLSFFLNLEFLKEQISEMRDTNLLAVFYDPPEHCGTVEQESFVFLGYDLMEKNGGASSLSNCGGFPEVFSNSELSQQGLLTDYSRAKQVQSELRRIYPGEPQADCTLWAIFRASQELDGCS